MWVPPGWVVDRFCQLLDKGGVDRHNVTLRASVLLYFEPLLKGHAFINSRAKSGSQTCVTGRRGKVRGEVSAGVSSSQQDLISDLYHCSSQKGAPTQLEWGEPAGRAVGCFGKRY